MRDPIKRKSLRRAPDSNSNNERIKRKVKVYPVSYEQHQPTPLNKNCFRSRTDFVFLRFHDSMLTIEAWLLPLVLPNLVDKMGVAVRNNLTEEALEGLLIIWNDRHGGLHLVELKALKEAWRGTLPVTAFLSYGNKKECTMPNLCRDVFAHNLPSVAMQRRVVGALDSHSPSSARLEHHLVLRHGLQVPSPILFEIVETLSKGNNSTTKPTTKEPSIPTPTPTGKITDTNSNNNITSNL